MCRISVVFEDSAGCPRTQTGLPEDRSFSGIGISVHKPISVGTKVKIKGRIRELAGLVQYGRPMGSKYAVGIRLDQQDMAWDSFGAGL